jgi:hypothetical protein
MSPSLALCVYVSTIRAVCICLYNLRCVCMSPAGPLLLVCVVCVYVSIICAVCVCLYNLRCVRMSLALPDWFDPRGILSVASVCPRIWFDPRGIFFCKSESASPAPLVQPSVSSNKVSAVHFYSLNLVNSILL